MGSPSNRNRAGRQSRWSVGALALCLALALPGCAPSGAGSITKTLRPQATVGTPQGVSAASAPGWSSYHNPTYGYIIEFPTSATFTAASTAGATSVTSWNITNPQASADHATLEITASSQASSGICGAYTSGQAVTLTDGVTAYQQDNLSDATSAGASAQPQIALTLLHSGLFYIITLTGQQPSATFTQRWGGVWSHVLATFQPGQGPAGAKPCG